MGNKLLLADDSITIQKVVGIIFANEDYELVVVDNGNAALDKARELLPDVILVDALMPGKTGYEVCEAVRREPSLKHIPLLLLTGAFEPFDEGKARQSGADDFISKPFESQHLIDKVKKLIEMGKERGAAATAAVPPAAAAPQFETFTAPVAAAVTAAAATFATAPLTADDVFAEPVPTASPFAAEPAKPAAVAPSTATVETELVEVSAEDDLWGAFDLEEVPADAETEFGAVVIEESPAPSDEFVFAEEGEVGTVEPATVHVEAAEDFGSKWEPVEEQTFEFPAEAAFPEESFPVDDPFAQLAASTASAPQEEMADFLAEPAASTVQAVEQQFAPEEEYVPVLPVSPAVAPPDMELQFAPEEEYVPVLAAEPAAASLQDMEQQFAPGEEYVPVLPVSPVAAPAVSVAATDSAPAVAAPAAVTELSEDQLTALVARISKDIIEKIVWEVVPELAERIIKEEVRKIKEGA